MSDERIEDGGPAFPTTPINLGYDANTYGEGTGSGPGMSLRDWFAGQALKVLAFSAIEERVYDVRGLRGTPGNQTIFMSHHVSTEGEDDGTFEDNLICLSNAKEIAGSCYRLADAMLQARKEPPCQTK